MLTTSQIPTELSTAKAKWCPFNTSQLSLRWDQKFGDVVKMRLDVHPEFQTVAEVLSSRWTGCRCQNKGSLKNDFFSAKGKCDLPLHRVWHSWKIKKNRMLNHFRSSFLNVPTSKAWPHLQTDKMDKRPSSKGIKLNLILVPSFQKTFTVRIRNSF